MSPDTLAQVRGLLVEITESYDDHVIAHVNATQALELLDDLTPGGP